MKQTMILLLLALPAAMQAQGLLKRIKDAGRLTAESRAETKAAATVDRQLDKLEGLFAKKKEQQGGTALPQTAPAAAATPAAPAAAASDSLKAYSAFDFVPGTEVLYATAFEGERRGEMPAGWHTNGSGEVVQLGSSSWIKLNQNAVFISSSSQAFGDNFTVEFDLHLGFPRQDALFPQVSFGLLATGKTAPRSAAVLQQLLQHTLLGIDLNAGMEQNSFVRFISFQHNSETFNSGDQPFRPLENLLQQTIRVSMQVQGRRLRVWLNQHKLFDLAQAVPEKAGLNQLFFRVFESSYTNEQLGVYATNIKIAKGISDARRLLQQGSFVTTGISFDVNSAVIKPGSYGVLKEIAAAIKEAGNIKIKITGHTDSDGSDADNLALSAKRSGAVKQVLVQEFGLDAALLTTEGMGESRPAAANSTPEGRAANRRVEFTRL